MDEKLYKEVLALLKKGMSIRDIAIDLEIPERLVYKVAKMTGSSNNPDGGKLL